MEATMDVIQKQILHRDDDHDHDHDEDEEDNPMVPKVVTMCMLFLLSMFIGCLPLQLSKWFKWNENPRKNITVILLLCFGGGVLLGTTFMHLLPEVQENLESLQAAGTFPDLDVHLAPLLMCLGFFTMYFVEECVHVYLRKREKKDLTILRRTHSIRRGDNEEIESTENEKLPQYNNNNNNQMNSHDHGHDHAGHSHLHFEDSIVKSIRGLLIVLALSVHELFEGLAVGLESTSHAVWYMFGAVSAHKLVIAFCIGVELISIGTKRLLAVLYIFTFAVVSPLGIGIGIIISDHESDVTDVISVILQGLASGTLLYVVFFEILQHDRKSGLRQWLTVAVGFTIMTLIVVFTHDHDHDH